jgi:diguanylate cyclase (GGDEF)-like protein/PAS domain S-box-containing protein
MADDATAIEAGGHPVATAVPTALLQAVVKSSEAVIVVSDESGRIVFVNERSESLLGYRPQELIGKGVEFLVPVPGNRERHREMRAQYLQNPVPRLMGRRPILTARHKSGATVRVEISLSPLPPIEGYGQLVQAAIKDAMPRWQIQQEWLLKTLAMDSAANGIVITDTRGIIESVNPAVTRMTGYSNEELVGQHTRLLKSGKHDETFYKQLWNTILDGRTWFGEITNRRKDGTLYYEEQHITPVLDDDGAIAHFIAIKQDVTARRTAETKLQEANLELARRLAEVESLQEQLRDQAIRDPLTGVFNRRYLDETLRREVIRAARGGMDLSVILMDVDDFKRINDTAGHASGDALLQDLVRVLAASARAGDFVCRLGGDEFVIVMLGAGLAVARQRADDLRKTFVESQRDCSLSLGVTQLEPGDSVGTLLQRADKALYRAKNEGRNRVAAVR